MGKRGDVGLWGEGALAGGAEELRETRECADTANGGVGRGKLI